MPLTNLNYYSGFPIDKVVYENEDEPLEYTVAGGGTTTTESVENPLGEKCLVTLAWSVDGVSYYPAQAYTAASAPYTANGWADNDNVYICLENFDSGSQTFRIIFALDTIE